MRLKITCGEAKHYVMSKKNLTELSSSLSDIVPSHSGNAEFKIEESYRGANPVRIATAEYVSENNLPPSWVNTVIAPIEKRDEGRLPGIEIPIRLKQDISNIDRIYYSFEINLINPNGEDNPSQYIFLEESYPIKILSFTSGSTGELEPDDELAADTATKFRSVRYLMGVGENSTGANRDEDVKNGGWERITVDIFLFKNQKVI